MFGKMFDGPLKNLSLGTSLTTELKDHEVIAALPVKHLRSNPQLLTA